MKSGKSNKRIERKLFDKESFAVRFKKLRTDRNQKQSDYAESLNTSVPTVSRLEQGLAAPDAETLLWLIDKYERDIFWLLTGKRQGDLSDDSEGGNVVRDKNIYNLLKTQREGLQQIMDLALETKGRQSKSIKLLRDKLAYMDALLDVGRDPDE
jgi:transcriptional regulator with XRE-family HTH domain